MNKELLKSKTFWTGVTSILGAVGGVVTGTLPVATAVQTGVTALLAIFIRDGIAKK
jgi:hypothetical protein